MSSRPNASRPARKRATARRPAGTRSAGSRSRPARGGAAPKRRAAGSGTARVPAPPRWRRRPDERPTEILQAALDTFVDRGFAATHLEEVARRAGVSKGTLYLYFDSKESLFKAVIRENVVVVLERGEQRAETHQGPTRDLLIELLRGWWEAVHESHLTGMPRLIFSEAAMFPDLARFYFEEVVARGRRLFAGVLQRGIERGEFREIDVDYAVRVIMAPIVMALIWKHTMVKCRIDPLDFDRHLDVFIDMILNGVVSRSAEPEAHA